VWLVVFCSLARKAQFITDDFTPPHGGNLTQPASSQNQQLQDCAKWLTNFVARPPEAADLIIIQYTLTCCWRP
jgi:hypothetical protein